MISVDAVTDGELVAYHDDELDCARRREIDAMLQRDKRLRHRLAALDIDQIAIKAAFDAVAVTAPVAEMRALLHRQPLRLPSQQSLGRSRRYWPRVALAFLLGVGLGYGANFAIDGDTDQSWHEAVANYQSMYVTETLAALPTDPTTERSVVAAVAGRLGLSATPEALVVRGLGLKRAQLLQFEGRSLGQFAYLASNGAPVSFCATRTRDADSSIRTGRFHGLPAAFWNKGGFGFIVIGSAPIEVLKRAATSLATQI
jgi:anti-sigma factor RsiW